MSLSKRAVRDVVDRMNMAYTHGTDSPIGRAASAWNYMVGGMSQSVADAGLPKPEWCDQDLWDRAMEYAARTQGRLA